MNLIGSECAGRTIARVFDICVGAYRPPTALASVQYDDKRFGVVVVDVCSRTVSPLVAEGRCGMLLSEAVQPPIFRINTDCGYYEVNIYTLQERGVVAREEYRDRPGGDSEWKVVGECSCGQAALKEFAKHGITFDAIRVPLS